MYFLYVLPLPGAALLCLLGCDAVSTNIEWVRVSSDIKLCGLHCDEYGIYTLDRDSSLPILDFACSDNSTNIYSNYQQRLYLNVSAGCCTIANAQTSDTGTYELSFYGERKKKKFVEATKYWVIDPISVSTIRTNRSDLGKTVALSFSYSGEEATVQWTWNGGALPERHQLSDSNKTLTVPSTDTGTFTVLVSNPVSLTSAHYNLTLPDPASESSVENRRQDSEFPSRSHAVRTGIIIAAAATVLGFAVGNLMCYRTASTRGPGGTKNL